MQHILSNAQRLAAYWPRCSHGDRVHTGIRESRRPMAALGIGYLRRAEIPLAMFPLAFARFT
jgi:hypothetical protein